MDKLLGILPYLYFEEPVQFGSIAFLGVPDWKGRDHAPSTDLDKQWLQELSTCFLTNRGLATKEGSRKAISYFLLENRKGKEAETIEEARKAITLLRYAMLRPDTQALDNIESSYMYAFALPPAGSTDYYLYQGWPNLNVEQEIWISPKHQKFPLPGWYVDFQLVHHSQMEDLEEIRQVFYEQRKLDKVDEIILAMEWYNQSFQKYSMRSIHGHLVDLSIAFETLFQLQENKVTLKEAVMAALNVAEESPVSRWAGAFYAVVRSATVHSGKPASLLFKHSEAQIEVVPEIWTGC